jgi:KDEL-tailed cysteine endopeptidase
MRSTFATLAVVGVAACVAVYALTAAPAGKSLYSNVLATEDLEYLKFIAKYGKSYGTKEEFEFRGDVFKNTLASLAEVNSQNDNTFRVGVNKFADWTPAEFKRILSYKPLRTNSPAVDYENVSIPDAIDWRSQGAVNPVKDQGQCGSCWAFSAVGAMESRNKIKNGKLLSLSEQQLVDCAGGSYGNLGCNGGDMGTAFQYAHDYGMESEADYPYQGVDQTCQYDKTKVVAKPAGSANVATNNAVALKTAIADGPVSVAIEADTFVFQFYSGGILNSKACGTNLDHGVVAVGYGADASGKPYYIVRNSWGSSWGVGGYVNIAIVDGAGICGIQMEPVYPIF